MDERIIAQKNFDHVQEWNDAGWDGKGITIWNAEGMGSHGQMTRSRLFDAAPSATVLNYGLNMSCSGKQIIYEYVQLEDGTKVSSDDFVKNNHITIVSHSHNGKSDKQQSIVDLWASLKRKYNLALFNAAGNEGSKGVHGGAIPESVGIYVGACVAFKDNYNDIRMESYSSIGDTYEEVDFSTFVGAAGWTGTSFSCPYLAGITALLQQRYGKDMTQAEIYAYFKMISQVIDSGHISKEDSSYDYWGGYGIPILPHVDKRYVVMEIGRKAYKIDGAWNEMDTAPFIEKQRTFVPIAFAAIALGAQVSWDDKDRKVTIIKGNNRLEMFIGSKSYLVNGKPYTMDVAPFIQDQRTFVPIAFAALALNCKVAWVPEDRKVLILEK